MTERIARHLTVTGHVQGVGYRWCMVTEAQRLGVDGWVRNRRDGSVEAVVHGSSNLVAALIDWAGHGPSGAAVSEVAVREWSGGVTPGFHQMPTV